MYRVLFVAGDRGERLALTRGLEQMLGPSGHGSAAGLLVATDSVGTTDDAAIAIALEPPDVLVLDVEMFTFESLCASVAAARRGGTSYVLLVSNRGEDDLAELARAVDANGTLRRPFSVAALEKQIRYWLAPRPSAPPGGRT